MAANPSAVEALLRPRSAAVIGMSSKAQSAGHVVLGNLVENDFAGDIHLVGRSGGRIGERTVLESVDQLPEGVDVAILTLPAASVEETIAACGRRKVKAAVVFAAGFAEMGDRSPEERLIATARAGGVAILGPNCLGYVNYIDGLQFNFTRAAKVPKADWQRDPATAIISQSGGLMGHVSTGLLARSLPTSYAISTGNEAGLGIADFIDHFIDDRATRSIVVYIEEARKPAELLASIRRAREAGKPVVLMHPGRSERANAAVTSHTGALAGNHAVMRTMLTNAGAIVVDTLDELIDVAELVARTPKLPTKGPGLVTFSGALTATLHDFCDALSLDIPALTTESVAALKPQLPAFAHTANPLDLTTQPVFQPDLMRIGPKALLDDANIGSLAIAIMPGSPPLQMKYLDGVIAAREGSDKPVLFNMLCDRSELSPEFLARAREQRVMFGRSIDRSLRALASVTHAARAWEAGKAARATPLPPLGPLPAFARGNLSEWQSKQVLQALGIATPKGALAKTIDEAVAAAAKIGFPVAMKAQAAALAHKTEAGAVKLNLRSEGEVREAWQTLQDNVRRAQPGLALDGILVEKMAERGVELAIGAKRDPRWGPVLMAGLGGIFIEALADVRLLPPDLDDERIIAELKKLRAAKLLAGFRGAPPADLAAVAGTVRRLGQLMLARPEIVEIDLNPVFVHEKGLTAADALIVTQR